MNAKHPQEDGNKERVKIFHWPKSRTVRDPNKAGSITDIWEGNYPTKERRQKLKIGGEENRSVTFLEKFFMTLLLVRTYIDWGYLLRKYVVTEKGESQFIEWYVFVSLLVLVIALCLPMPFWLEVVIGILIGWEIIGFLFVPLRIVLVDRYAKDWAPYSYNRSLIFLFVNYCEMVIGFAYMYRHFNLVRWPDCAKPLTALQSLYFSVVTITTLGYGDLRPISRLGRFFASMEPIFGIFLLVMVVGLFFVELGRQREKNDK